MKMRTEINEMRVEINAMRTEINEIILLDWPIIWLFGSKNKK